MARVVKTCPECGHKTCVYSHHLNRPLVSALRQLADHYASSRRPANLQVDLSLTKNQYNNFQKLQYFGLVKRAGGRGWVPTPDGVAFLNGTIKVRNVALTLGGDPLSYEHDAWRGRKHRVLAVFEINEASYKKAPEYKLEKSGPPAQARLL